MFGGLISKNLARAISDRIGQNDIAELRLRINRAPLVVATSGQRINFAGQGAPCVVTREDIDGILARATNMSLYSVSEEILQGYIPACGLRIGVGGEGVWDRGRLIGMKNISYLVIRAPHQIKGAADAIFDKIAQNCDGKLAVKSTIVIAPPCGGKTTLLREIARKLSAFKSTVIIDERFEIACCVNGAPTLDIGDAEVVSGVKKCVAYENVLRAMSPEALVTDELFANEELQFVKDAARSGVKIFASAHGDSVESLKKSEMFASALKYFDVAIVLGTSPIGSVRAIADL